MCRHGGGMRAGRAARTGDPRAAGLGAASGEDEAGRPLRWQGGLRLPRLPPAQAIERPTLGTGAQTAVLPAALAVATRDATDSTAREGADPPTRCHADLRAVIAELNPVLRGWGQYFRTGNAATDSSSWTTTSGDGCDPCAEAHGSRPSTRRGDRLDECVLEAWGYIVCAGLSAIRRPPFGNRIMLPPDRSLVSRVREIRMHGLVGGPDSSCCLWVA